MGPSQSTAAAGATSEPDPPQQLLLVGIWQSVQRLEESFRRQGEVLERRLASIDARMEALERNQQRLCNALTPEESCRGVAQEVPSGPLIVIPEGIAQGEPENVEKANAPSVRRIVGEPVTPSPTCALMHCEESAANRQTTVPAAATEVVKAALEQIIGPTLWVAESGSPPDLLVVLQQDFDPRRHRVSLPRPIGSRMNILMQFAHSGRGGSEYEYVRCAGNLPPKVIGSIYSSVRQRSNPAEGGLEKREPSERELRELDVSGYSHICFVSERSSATTQPVVKEVLQRANLEAVFKTDAFGNGGRVNPYV